MSRGKTLRSTAAGQYPENRLGQSNLIRAVGGETKVACERQFVTAAHAVAVDRSDHGLRHQHDPVEHPMESGRSDGKNLRAGGRVRGHRGQLVDAVVRDEFAVDSAGENDRASVGVVLGAADEFEQLLRHRCGHVVHRRIADGPDLDVLVLIDGKMFHRFFSTVRE